MSSAPAPIRRRVRQALLGLMAVVVVLAAVATARTLGLASHQIQVEPVELIPVDGEAAARRLAGAIQIRTVSHHDRSRMDMATFAALRAYLAQTFPRTHATLQVELVHGASLLFTWAGADPTRRPILLMSHQDVVPVNPGTEGDWVHPPFSGAVASGYVWGRGTMDVKVGVLGVLEGVEALLAAGFVPQRTVMLAFGHDEEVGGTDGAAHIASLLVERGVRPEFVLDEGLVVTEGIVPGVSAPVATVGIAEKGYLSVELTAEALEGHSSMPPRETAVGIIAGAVQALGHAPFPARHGGALAQMFEWLAPEVSFGKRLAFANLWLLGWVVEDIMSRKPSTDATQRTTTAPTMMTGSTQENVLPKRASAVVNFRILPGDTVTGVLDRVTALIDDPRVGITPLGAAIEPSPVSSVSSPGFEALHRSIRETFPDAIVVPAPVVGMTDSRYFAELADDVYRFNPLRVGPEDTRRFHGTNERVAVSNYAEVVQFYAQLIRNAAGRQSGAGVSVTTTGK